MGTTWANEVNFGINHAPGAGSISRPVDPATFPGGHKLAKLCTSSVRALKDTITNSTVL